MQVIVVGVATGSREIETWAFDSPELCKAFCEQLVRSTGNNVWVIEGAIVGKYCLEEMPVTFIPKNKINN